MTTQAHTSGPWAVGRHATPESCPQFGIYAENGNGRDLAHVVSHGTATSAETESNARLIAAAPDLLEALRGAVGYAEMEGGFCNPPAWYIFAKNAIAKAEGGES